MRHRRQTTWRGALLGAALALPAAAPADDAPPQQPENVDIAAGAALYAAHCAACHGADLEGQPDWRVQNPDGTLPAPPHDETGHTWHHGDALLFTYTRLGGQRALQEMGIEGVKSAMPGFGEVLSDQQIWDILAYIKSTWPARLREMQAARTEAEQMRAQ